MRTRGKSQKSLWQTRGRLETRSERPILTDHDLVLVVDFGAQYAQLIARRVREAKVYSEIVPHAMPVAGDARQEARRDHPLRRPLLGLRAGRPGSRPGAVRGRGPVFGMCYGFQAMAQVLGGEVARTGVSEFGRTPVLVTDPGTLLAELPDEHRVWMSHGDSVAAAPEGFDVLASTAATPVAAFEDTDASARRACSGTPR